MRLLLGKVMLPVFLVEFSLRHIVIFIFTLVIVDLQPDSCSLSDGYSDQSSDCSPVVQ